MKKNLRVFVVLLFALTLPFAGISQRNYFNVAGSAELAKVPGENYLESVTKFIGFKVNHTDLKNFLSTLPQEDAVRFNRGAAPIMAVPMPDGSFGRFRVWESSVQEPELQAKYPEIRTYAGQGIDDPYATVRFEYNPYFGFSAQILSHVNGRVYVDQLKSGVGNTDYVMSYFHKDNLRNPSFGCGTPNYTPEEEAMLARVANVQAACRGTSLRTLRTAVACTGEYSQRVASSNPAATHAAIVAVVDRITGVYETEITVKLMLVANNNLIEFTNASTDPFTNVVSSQQISRNNVVIDSLIGNSNYDIGHLFTTDPGGGLAGLGVVCVTGQKGRGATGLSNPVGDGYAIDFVAHELGHQLGGPHTFNSDQCASAGGGVEPGSGSTIMAYAGVCVASHNIQPHSDPMFHGKSYDAISSTLIARSCGTETPTGNTLPVINSLTQNNLSIPISTPFVLTGDATDADADAISYCWEGWDVGPAGNWTTAGTTTDRPLFRDRVPKATGSRTFPDMRVIVANYPTNPPSVMDGLRGEVLASVPRQMRFRLTVRDNRAGGGAIVSYGASGCQTAANYIVNTVGTVPFRVIAPNGGESYPGGSTQTITWDIAGTDGAPINVSNVKITLSEDGGLTYPHVLANSTPNDGSEALVIPALGQVATCRIRIEAIDNIFFDISNQNFAITGSAAPSYSFNDPGAVAGNCGDNSVSVTVGTTAVGGFNTPIALASSGNPTGTTVSLTPNPVTPGSSFTATLNNTNTLAPGTYNYTITGTAGSIVRTSLITVNIIGGAGPTITTQPLSQSICLGSGVSFTVATAGSATFQWQVSTDGGNNWNNISGATSTTYSVPVTTLAMDNYQYRVIVSGSCGTSTSDNAVLTLTSSPDILIQPANQSSCVGGSVSFTVNGRNVTSYQWQVSTDGGATWNNVSGATSPTLTVNSVNASQNGNMYHVVLTNACGTTTSTNVVLSVTAGAVISSQPSNASVCAGQNVTFSVVATGAGIGYQWQVSTNGGSGWTNISGATGAAYTINSVTAGLNNNQYRVIISTACGTPVTSSAAVLTVTQGPTITTQPAAVIELCEGSSASFTVAATNATGYQWQVSTDLATTWSDIPGATSATLTIPNVTAAMHNNFYRVSVSGCATPTISNNAMLFVISTPVVNAPPQDVSSCVGGDAQLSVGGMFIESYQWQVSTDGGITWTNISGSVSDTLSLNGVTAGMNGNKYRVILSNHCTATTTASNPATLTIVAGAAITGQPANTEVCAGVNASFTVTATGSTGYQWQVSTNGGTNWSDVSGATSATLTLTAVTQAMHNNQYRVVVSGCGPNGITSTPATLTITPATTVTTQPADATVCPGADANFSAAGANATGYQWQVSTDGGATWNNISGATNTALTITGATAGMNNNKYRVVLSGACGAVNSDAATLTVSATPVVTTQPASISACVGADGSISVVASNATTYQWQVSTDGGTTWNDVSGATSTTLTLSAVTSGMNNNQYHVIVTGPCGNVTSNAAALTVNALPVVVANGPGGPVCAGESVTLTGGGATTYTWNNNVTNNVPFVITTTTTYTVTGTDGNGCSNTDDVTVSVNPIPVVTLVASQTEIAPGETATLTATSDPAATGYVWYLNGVEIAGATGASITIDADQTGTYTVEAITAGGCSAVSAAVVITLGTSNYAFITPNSNNGIFKVNYPNEGLFVGSRVVTIYDESGKLIYKKNFSVNFANAIDVIDIHLPHLTKGAYWLMLSEVNGRRLKTGKFIVH